MSALKLNSLGKTVVAIAAGLAVLASVYILFAPLHVQLIPTFAVSRGSEIPPETRIQQTWYQMEGLWGILALVLFSGLFSLGYYLARQAAYDWLGVLSIGLLLLSYLSGTSFGFLYLPAAGVLLLGTGLLIYSSYRQGARGEAST